MFLVRAVSSLANSSVRSHVTSQSRGVTHTQGRVASATSSKTPARSLLFTLNSAPTATTTTTSFLARSLLAHRALSSLAARRTKPFFSSPLSSSSSSSCSFASSTSSLFRLVETSLRSPFAIVATKRSLASESANGQQPQHQQQQQQKQTTNKDDTNPPADAAATAAAAAADKSAEHAEDVATAVEGEAEAAQLKDTSEQLMKEINEKNAKIKELTDHLAYTLAAMQNLERMTKQENENVKKFGIQKFAVELLDVHDNLLRAIKAVPEEQRGSEPAASLLSGVEMVAKQLTRVFGKFDIAEMNPLGEKFDANKHEALFRVKAEAERAGTVAQVAKTGYTLKDRVIRPAQVGVFYVEK